MVLDSSDLQQRHTATTSKTITKGRTSSSNGGPTNIRRRRRKSDPNRAAFIATLLFAVIAIPFIITSRLLIGKGSTNKSAAAVDANRFLKEWKPKSANTNLDGTTSDAADERAKQREARYQSLYKPKFDESTLGYDIYNCPHTPPKDYPKTWTTTEVLGAWEPEDVTTLPPNHRDVYQGICVFDHQTQYETALNYRNAEKPFIIRNDPKVTSVARRWEDDPEYLHRILGDVEEFRTERTPDGHLMWYRLRGKRATPKGYVKPENDEIEMTFGEYLEHAIEKDGRALGDEELIAKALFLKERRLSLKNGKEEENEADDGDDGEAEKDEDSEEEKQKKYYYFRVNADLRKSKEKSPSKFVYDELTFFDPRKEEESEFYMVDPKEERGINCRFGMRGLVAANHFDMSRNMIAVLGGERRYVIASPTQCGKMALHPYGHPSVRHSSVDWTEPSEWDDHPEFKGALINEVVLHAGDVLYLPTNWFHFIVNLSLNYQCNARSGTSHETAHFINECGFQMSM